MYIDANGDSIVVAYVPIPASDATHTLIVRFDEKTGERQILAEGMPESRDLGLAVCIGQVLAIKAAFGQPGFPTSLTSGEGWGNLTNDEPTTNVYDLESGPTDKIDVPDGVTEDEYAHKIDDACKSYSNDVRYAAYPAQGRSGNGNSLVGSVLRYVGADYVPRGSAAGWYVDVLPSQKIKGTN